MVISENVPAAIGPSDCIINYEILQLQPRLSELSRLRLSKPLR